VPSRSRAPRLLIAVIGTFVAIGVLANLGSWIHGPGSTLPSCGGNCQADPLQFTWFLAFTPYSLIHGQNPFLSNLINYPMGVNMMSNTFMPLLGILSTPFLLAGPAAALNTMSVLAFAGSATAAFFVFSRWTAWMPAAFGGALFFEISPYMASGGIAHLDLIAVPIPPLILLLLDEILVRQSAHATRTGMVLGVLVGLQLLISPEVFATTILMSVIGVILLVAFRATEVRARVGYATRALATGVVAALVVDVYPMWLFLFGPEHVNGPIQSRLALNPLSNDLFSFFVPSSVQRLDPSGLQHVTNVIAPAGLWAAENGAYIGIPLFALLLLIVVRYWRIGIVRFAAAMTTVGLVLSLGPTLIVDGHHTGFPLPFRAAANLPLFEDLVASRFSLYTGFFIALLLAVGLDQLWRYEWPIRSRRAWVIAAVVLGAVGLVSVLPSWPYPTSKPDVPPLLRQGAPAEIPHGSVILTYPFPRWPFVQPMYWQAVDRFDYSLVGGYIYSVTPSGSPTLQGTSSLTETFLESCEYGENPTASPSDLASVADDLHDWNISTVIVTSDAPDPQCAVRLFTGVLRRGPTLHGGMWVWIGVQSSLGGG
jgi:hypothetical protein